jgi:hypothetical protein
VTKEWSAGVLLLVLTPPLLNRPVTRHYPTPLNPVCVYLETGRQGDKGCPLAH